MQIIRMAKGNLFGQMRARFSVAVGVFVTGLLASTLSAGTAATIIEQFQPNVWPGGRAVAVTVSPNNSSIAIVASESGGLFQTHDGGNTWRHLDGLLPFRMADVKYSPSSSQRVVATAFADSRTGNRGGIWMSTDGGATWHKPAGSNPGCPTRASAFGISYVTSGIFVGTDCGVAISPDGTTWTHVVPDPSAPSRRIVSVVAHGQGIVDICGDAGIFRSTDNGAHWGPASSSVGGCTQLGTHLIDASPLNQDVLFVTTVPNTLFESNDGGRNWTTLNPPAPAGGRPSWLKASTALAGHPNQFDLFFGNAYNVVRQTCNNQTGLNCANPWTSVTINFDGLHDPNGFSFDASGNTARFLVTDAGVYSTADGGMTFTIVGGGAGGYNALQVYEVAGQIHPDHSDLYFGTQDNCLWASPDDGRTWSNPRCPEGFALQMKRSTPSHSGEIITGSDVGFGNFKSSDHFTNFDHWKDPDDNAGNPLIIDSGTYVQYVKVPGTPSTGIDLTTNSGGTWNPVMVPGTANPFMISDTPSFRPQIVGPAAHPTLYQAVQRPPGPTIGLVKIDLDVANRTASLARADVAGLGSLGAFGPGQGTFDIPTVFGVDPHDPQHVIAPDIANEQMKVTRDGGNTWRALPQLTSLILNAGEFLFNVPNGPMQVHSVAFDPDIAGHILVGTEAAGIFESFDDGQAWTEIPFSDFFIRSVSNFFFDRDRIVIVATYGRGLWKLVPGSLPPTLCNNPRSRCTIDVRTPLGEWIYPRWACPRPPELPTCQVIGLSRGVINDLEVREGALKRLALSGGELVAYDIDGKKVDLSLPVNPSKSGRPGAFSGCTACADMRKEGGAITGLIIHGDRVAAVIGQFSSTPTVAKLLPIAGKKEKQVPGQALPYLQLVGTIPVTGQTIAATGDTFEAYGSGFCAAPGCSTVTIRIGNRVAVKNVDVDEKGTFKATVTVTEMAGQYRVTASQTTGNNKELRDERLLVVPVIDKDNR
jgi:photosystem II stability/assembly factor-like uncharacterized protein